MATPPFKFVLAPASDVTDPPSNPIFTIDNLTGVEPPQIPEAMWATPYDFGAIGDGSSDDTQALQNWLNAIAGGVGFLKTGTYMVSSVLVIKSNTTIYGAGIGSAVIKSQPFVPQNFIILRNENIVTDPTKRLDRNIFIYNVCFQGDSSTPVTGNTEFVVFVGVQGLIIQNCKFWKRLHFLLDISNCSNVRIDRNEMTEWGVRTYSGPPGQYTSGTAIFVLTAGDNFWVTNNWIHNGAGGIWLPVAMPAPTQSLNCVCTGNIIEDVVEFGITQPPNRAVISDNIIVNVHRVDVSGHGMELFGTNYTITNNVIDLCDSTCLYFFDPVGVVVSHNILQRSNQGMNPNGGAITVNAFGAALGGGANPPSYLTITNNGIFNSDGKGASAIAFVRYSADPTFLMNNLLVANNNLGPNFWTTGKPIDFIGGEASVRGANFMIRDNLGAGPNDWSTNVLNFIIPTGSSGTVHIGAVGFRASWIQFQSVLPSPSTVLSASIGQNAWTTGWDIASQTVVFPKAYGVATGICWASDGTKSFSADWSGRHSINIFDASGHPICAATLLALSDDGFDILILESLVGDIATGGTSYAVGDTGAIAGGDGLAQYTVGSVSGGVVTGVAITGGSGYSTASGVVTTPSTGTGDGALTLDLFSGSPTTAPAIVTAVCHA